MIFIAIRRPWSMCYSNRSIAIPWQKNQFFLVFQLNSNEFRHEPNQNKVKINESNSLTQHDNICYELRLCLDLSSFTNRMKWNEHECEWYFSRESNICSDYPYRKLLSSYTHLNVDRMFHTTAIILAAGNTFRLSNVSQILSALSSF